ncbi:MAG: hypothetical protein WC655_24470 [Candidatus Hydrogenedentales bacterium]
MQGGIFTLGGFAQGLNALMNVVRAAVVASGPWALLALAIGAVIGVLRGLMTMANKAEREVKKTGEATSVMTERAKELGAAFAKVQGDKLAEELKSIAKEADAALRQFKLLAEIQKELRGERLKQEEIRIKADPKFKTDEERAIALLRLRQSMSEKEREESVKALDVENQLQLQKTTGMQREIGFKRKDLADLEDELLKKQLQLADRKTQEAIIAQTTKDMEGLVTGGATATEAGSQMFAKLRAEEQAARTRLKEIPFETELVSDIVALQEPIGKLTEAINKLIAELKDETSKLADMRAETEISRTGAVQMKQATRATTEAETGLVQKALLDKARADLSVAQETTVRLSQMVTGTGNAAYEAFQAAQVNQSRMADNYAKLARQSRNKQNTNGP